MSVLRRLVPVWGLFLFAPYCAEFLVGYQGPVVDPLGLLVGLFLLAGPLYGTAAILIREITRRTGRGWPTMLTLSAAFGLVQAGLIDQALFNHEFAGDTYWQVLPSVIPGLGIDLSQLLVFVVGHMIWSFAAPIAVVESWVPRSVTRPWLGPIGLGITAVVYLAAAVFFNHEFVAKAGFHADPVRLIGTAAVVVALVGIAFAIPRLSKHDSGSRAPRPSWVGLVSLVLIAGHILAREPEPGEWARPSLAAAVLVLVVLGIVPLRWSRRPGWSVTHVLAAASAPLLAYALLAFAVPPQDATMTAKYASNVIALVALIALLAVGYRRSRRDVD